MPTFLDADKILFGTGLIGIATWLLVSVFRLFRGDAGQAQVIKSLREELTRKDEQLRDKEQVIQTLVKEKAVQMEQLAEIPKMRDEIQGMEEKIESLVRLINHLIASGALTLKAEHQLELMKLFANGEGK